MGLLSIFSRKKKLEQVKEGSARIVVGATVLGRFISNSFFGDKSFISVKFDSEFAIRPQLADFPCNMAQYFAFVEGSKIQVTLYKHSNGRLYHYPEID